MSKLRLAISSIVAGFVLSVIISAAFASDTTKVNLNGTNIGSFFKVGKLNDAKTVYIKDVISNATMPALIKQYKALADDRISPIFVLIDSPGGSVDAGMEFIDAMQSARDVMGVKSICIIENSAYSMAAIIAAFCNRTYIIRGASMMFHDATVGIQAPINSAKNRILFYDKWLREIDQRLAKQLGVSLDEYNKLKSNELWITTNEAISYGYVDGIAEGVYHNLTPKQPDLFQVLFGIFRIPGMGI